jgi:hypothetical protein
VSIGSVTVNSHQRQSEFLNRHSRMLLAGIQANSDLSAYDAQAGEVL